MPPLLRASKERRAFGGGGIDPIWSAPFERARFHGAPQLGARARGVEDFGSNPSGSALLLRPRVCAGVAGRYALTVLRALTPVFDQPMAPSPERRLRHA